MRRGRSAKQRRSRSGTYAAQSSTIVPHKNFKIIEHCSENINRLLIRFKMIRGNNQMLD